MIRTVPRPYQKKGINQIQRWKGVALLADEMGLGKTLQALVWWHRNRNVASPMIVVCPASVKYNWENEIRKHLGKFCTVLEGRGPKRHDPGFRHHCRIFVLNYEILEAWLPWIISLKPKTLVFDEAHYVKNHQTKRSRAVKKLSRICKYVIALSGTPLLSRPSELWSTLNILMPKKYPSFARYANRYCNPKRRPWGMDYRGAVHLDELHRLLKKDCMIRRLKVDVLPELPAKIRTVVPMDLTNRKEYREAERDFLSWLGKRSRAKAHRAKSAERLVQMGYLRQLAAEGKLSGVKQWVQDFLDASDDKLILFAHHKKIIRALRERFGSQALVIDGSVTGKKRFQIVNEFNQRAVKRVLIGNIKAAGIGVNLTAAADVAFAEFAWTPGEHIQAEDRTHRIGQTRGVNCWYLSTTGTIEEDLCLLIQTKQSIINQTLDGIAASTELNVFDHLMKAISERSQL